MVWELKNDRPIYAQLIDQIKLRIISGFYRAGDRLPSVRDMASEASVNPNTMQRALAELERDGLVYTQRTSGRFITEDTELIRQAKDSLAMEQIKEFFQKMNALGYDTVSYTHLDVYKRQRLIASILRISPSADSPAPRPVTSADERPIRTEATALEVVVLPIPISPVARISYPCLLYTSRCV